MPAYAYQISACGPLAAAAEGLRCLVKGVFDAHKWFGPYSTLDTHVFIGEMGYAITSASIASGVLMIHTREPHNLQPGQEVTLAGAAIGEQSAINLAGKQKIASASGTTVTITTSLPDQTVEFPEQAFLAPGSRPFAVIMPDDSPLASRSIGSGGVSIFSGSLLIVLEDDLSQTCRNSEFRANMESQNSLGLFMQALAATQGTGDFICLNTADVLNGPLFTEKVEQDDSTIRFERWRAAVRVTWGLEG